MNRTGSSYSTNDRHVGRTNGRGQRPNRTISVAAPNAKLVHSPNSSLIEVGRKSSRGLGPRKIKRVEPKLRIFTKSWLDTKTPIELCEDLNNPETLVFGVCRNGKIDFCDRLEFDGSVLVPPSRLIEPYGSMHFPSGALAYGSPELLAGECAGFFREIVHLPEPDERIISVFVLHASIWDRLPFAVCPVLYGPRDVTDYVVKALNLICRRSMLVASASAREVLGTCSGVGATMLFFGDSLSKPVVEIFDAGSQADFLHLRGGTTVSSFGPKIIVSCEAREDLEHLRGSFPITLTSLEPARWSVLFSPSFLARACKLRKKLLQFRFDHIARMPIPIDEAGLPYPKWGLIAGSLAAPFAANGSFRKEIFEYFRGMDMDPVERLPVRQSGVLSAGFYACHDKKLLKAGEVTLGEFADEVNRLFKAFGEQFRISPRKAGAILDGLGFPRRLRSSHGYRLSIDLDACEIFHRLARRYGLLNPDPYAPVWSRASCKLCAKYGIVGT